VDEMVDNGGLKCSRMTHTFTVNLATGVYTAFTDIFDASRFRDSWVLNFRYIMFCAYLHCDAECKSIIGSERKERGVCR
jgi:hypothetical protein